MKKVWEMTETVLRHVLGTKIVLIFAVIALSLILLQAGSVSSAEEPIIYKGHTIRPDGSGNFEVAGKGGFNYSQFSHKAWDYAYMNVSNYIGVNKEVTLSSDAYVGSLERFNTTSQTWNVTNISIFNNGSLITRGITFNLLNAQNNQFRVLISNTAKDDGTYSWFLNTSILGTMYVLEFDPISEGVNVAGQSKGSTPAFVSPSTWTLTPNNINDENFVNNAQTGDSGFSTIRFVI
ncbi:hypothetical protein HYY73_06360, partial [Candidatus Woesearchaeota archaeon]|nr:hypothetical protein [Candidatus Woesearchaeota archaeon]